MAVKLPKCNRTPQECLNCRFTDICDKDPSTYDIHEQDRLDCEIRPRKGHSSAEYMREWRERHKTEVREYNRKYRETHKKQQSEYMTAWWDENRTKKRAYCREYYRRHREEILAKQRADYWKKRAENATTA